MKRILVSAVIALAGAAEIGLGSKVYEIINLDEKK